MDGGGDGDEDEDENGSRYPLPVAALHQLAT